MSLPYIEMTKYKCADSIIYYHVVGGIGRDEFYVGVDYLKKQIQFFKKPVFDNPVKIIDISDASKVIDFEIFGIDRRTIVQICGKLYQILKKDEFLPDKLSFM